MGAGLRERETPDLPSELRLVKYKNMAGVKRIAASELRQAGPAYTELAFEVIIFSFCFFTCKRAYRKKMISLSPHLFMYIRIYFYFYVHLFIHSLINFSINFSIYFP
jgi:hypothetical protein